MLQVHHEAAWFLRSRTAEANSQHARYLADRTTKESSLAMVSSWKNEGGLPDLGLEKIELSTVSSKHITLEALRIYSDAITKARKGKAEEDTAKEENRGSNAGGMCCREARGGVERAPGTSPERGAFVS